MDSPTQTFKYNSASGGYYDDLIVSISYAEFCNNADCIIARDYFTVKFWDTRNNAEPCLKIDVLEGVDKSMNELYHSQAICAEFEAKDSQNSDYCITGGYGKIMIIDRVRGTVRQKIVENQEEILHIDVGDNGEVAFATFNNLGIFNFNRYI